MSKIGLLYSTATGIVLRTINPDSNSPGHLDWVDQNKPAGTTLIRIDKSAVGADDNNCPNLDVLIPHVKKNFAVNLSFGQNRIVVDSNNKIVDVVLCCPVLYQTKLSNDAIAQGKAIPRLLQLSGSVGDTYNPLTNTVTPISVDIDISPSEVLS